MFVHFSSLPREYQRGGGSSLKVGDRVSFDVEVDRNKGKSCAKNVKVESGGGTGGGSGRGVRGVVKNFDDEKGFGFLKPDDDGDAVFVHFSSLPRNFQRGGDSTLQSGDRVVFDIEIDDRKGKECAKNVQVLGGCRSGGKGGDHGGKGRDGQKGMSAERKRQLFGSLDESPSPRRPQRSRSSRSPSRQKETRFRDTSRDGFGDGPDAGDGGCHKPNVPANVQQDRAYNEDGSNYNEARAYGPDDGSSDQRGYDQYDGKDMGCYEASDDCPPGRWRQ